MAPSPVRVAARRIRRCAQAARSFDPWLYLPPPAPPGTEPTSVGLVGYFGWGNYGDELFRDVFREHLEPRHRLHVVFDSLEPPYATQRLRKIVDGLDAILIGGGDLVSPWSPRSRYWAREHLRRPVFIAGVGVPTWRAADPEAVSRMRRFFRDPAVRYVHARDAESAAWIEEHLGPAVPVITAPDLVCALTLPEVERPADPPILGLVIRRRDRPDDLVHARRLVRRGMELGYRVRAIVLATGQTQRKDLEATRELAIPDVEVVVSDDLDILTRAIGECTVLATMKFHGLVVATMFGVPALALIRTDKSRNFLRRIGRPDLLSGIDHPDLADRLTRDPVPIDRATRDALRAETVDVLADLSRRLADPAGG